jgi:urease accessory protein UreF
MRLLPVGQSDAHAMLARVLERVPGVAVSVERRVRDGWRPGSFTPLIDLAQMRQPYVHSRLFLS